MKQKLGSFGDCKGHDFFHLLHSLCNDVQKRLKQNKNRINASRERTRTKSQPTGKLNFVSALPAFAIPKSVMILNGVASTSRAIASRPNMNSKKARKSDRSPY